MNFDSALLFLVAAKAFSYGIVLFVSLALHNFIHFSISSFTLKFNQLVCFDPFGELFNSESSVLVFILLKEKKIILLGNVSTCSGEV